MTDSSEEGLMRATPRRLPGTIALAFSVLLVGSLPSLTGCTQSTMPGWASATSPNTPASDNQLFGVAADSAGDVWAVGYSTPTAGGLSQTLIEHFDGSMWKHMESQDITGASDRLHGVAAFSPNNVWAVGESLSDVSQESQPLIEFYNGLTWSIVGSPPAPGDHNSLWGVAAVSATEVWAVGYSVTGGLAKPLIEHYLNGSWSLYGGPGVSVGPDTCGLNGVAVVPGTAPATLWTVGQCGPTSIRPTQPFIERYDGSSWKPYLSTPTGRPTSILNGVAADSANDVWAVGYSTSTGAGGLTSQTLIEHFAGNSWAPVPNSVNQSVYYNFLSGVAAVTSGDVWAVGYYTTGFSADAATYTLIEHFNGNNWTIENSPNWNLENNYLTGVVVVPGTAPARLWAVGYYGHRHPTSLYQTFVLEH
jgi:hypothetical protein